MDLVKLYQQIKETCTSIDQKIDLLREDIRKLSSAEGSPTATSIAQLRRARWVQDGASPLLLRLGGTGLSAYTSIKK